MTNKLNLTPMGKLQSNKYNLSPIDSSSSDYEFAMMPAIHNQYESMKNSKVTDYNAPLYERPWTMAIIESILQRWYGLDMNVNDLIADDLKLLQAFYKRFKRLDPEEQRILINVYHPY